MCQFLNSEYCPTIKNMTKHDILAHKSANKQTKKTYSIAPYIGYISL